MLNATPRPARVVAIDDDPDCVEFIRAALEPMGVSVAGAVEPQEGLARIEEERPDIAFIDVMMPGATGWTLLEKSLRLSPLTEVVLMTAYYSTDDAVQAVRRGASDYLTKPFSIGRLSALADKLLTVARPAEDSDRVRTGIVGSSPALQRTMDLIRRVAPHYRCALITGSTGSGKELAARALHEASPARGGPFVACNCAAISPHLIESELFGHTRGAFTGATHGRGGLFEQAHGGTLFLDEIGETPRDFQAKLLRVLEDREVRRIGSSVPQKVDVRVIAASNRDLRASIETGEVRDDLFYRLSMVEIRMPSLRDRVSDVPALARHFVSSFGAEYGKPLRGVTPKALAVLSSHGWPGNVRELRNVIGHACMLAEGEWVDVAHLPSYLFQAAPLAPAGTPPALEELARRHIGEVLETVSGDKQAACRILGISRATLYRRLAEMRNRARA